MIDFVKVGNVIMTKRRQLNMTQDDLANHLFVTRQLVSKWENGTGVPSIDVLIELSKLFKIPVEELLCLNEEFIVNEENIFSGHNRMFVIENIINNNISIFSAFLYIHLFSLHIHQYHLQRTGGGVHPFQQGGDALTLRDCLQHHAVPADEDALSGADIQVKAGGPGACIIQLRGVVRGLLQLLVALQHDGGVVSVGAGKDIQSGGAVRKQKGSAENTDQCQCGQRDPAPKLMRFFRILYLLQTNNLLMVFPSRVRPFSGASGREKRGGKQNVTFVTEWKTGLSIHQCPTFVKFRG